MKPKKCYVLYVNLTSSYISFKIEKADHLGPIKTKLCDGKYSEVVEHVDDEVNYVSKEDIFDTEDDAVRGLIKMLEKRVKN